MKSNIFLSIIKILSLSALIFFSSSFQTNSANAAIIENWDSISSSGSPSAPGVAYSIGDGWTAMASSDYLTQGTFYQVANSGGVGFATGAQSSPNIVVTANGQMNRDFNTTSMIVLSPYFTLDGTGDPITAAILGGANGGTSIPTSITGIGSTLAADGNGWQGIALVDMNGNIVSGRTAQRPGGSDYHYATASISTAGLDSVTPYRLALIDTFSGGYGWVGLDNVSIPGNLVAVPEPSSFVLLGAGLLGLAIYRRHRTRG